MVAAANNAPSTSEAFNCDFADHSSKQSFQMLSQDVHISELNFVEKSFRVHTDILVVPLVVGLAEVSLDLGNDCILPGEQGFYGNGSVVVNGIPAHFTRNRLQIQLDNEGKDRSIFCIKNAFTTALINHSGDLIVSIPYECQQHTADQRVIRIGVDLIVSSPRQGIIFSSSGRSFDQDAHVFTVRSSLLSSTKCWLPCVESASQLGVWRFEITVPNLLAVVCCGDLVDTIPCADNETCKTFHYQLLTPTSAVNIGFAIGNFQVYVQPDMPEIISFVLPGLMPLLKHTVSILNRIFNFFEETLSSRFPYGFYRQVFVNHLPDEMHSFAGLTIFSLQLLHHKKILDMVQPSRQRLAHAIATQFFGCFVNPADFGELWLVKSLARFMTGLFVERFFGTSEYLFQMNKTLKQVCDYESKYGRIVISSSKNPHSTALQNAAQSTINGLYFDPNFPETCSSLYANALYKKGHFVMTMLQKRLAKDQFLKVLQRILNVATQYSQHLSKPIDWFHMIISVDSFFQSITNVTGRELPSFIDQWIHSGGYVFFEVNHTFNRKQNKLELELKQNVTADSGLQSYVGPLTVIIQELDGCFTHTVQVDAAISKHDIVCHSKGRKQKKKRVPLSTGEEVEIDLLQMDADSPVMWIRVDPEMLILRQINLAQQLHQWEYMFRYERDVLAQQQAIEMLYQYPVHQTQAVLMEVIENEKFFYKHVIYLNYGMGWEQIRGAAARCLVDICNRLPEGLIVNQHPLIAYFQRLNNCKSAPSIPQPNNYIATSTFLQHYFFSMELLAAIGRIRCQNSLKCPPSVLEFLLNLIKLNDNSNNRYSDDYYRAALITALGNTIVLNDFEVRHPERMTEEARCVLSEVLHALNMDTMKPSFGKIITCHCLYVIQSLQRNKHIPLDLNVFWKFAQCRSIYANVRRAAFNSIIALIYRGRQTNYAETVLRLVDVVLTDPDPYIRQKVVEQLCLQAPFNGMHDAAQTTIFPMNTPRLANVLWQVCRDPMVECQVRTAMVDLYYVLYGRETPMVLRGAGCYDPMFV